MATCLQRMRTSNMAPTPIVWSGHVLFYCLLSWVLVGDDGWSPCNSWRDNYTNYTFLSSLTCSEGHQTQFKYVTMKPGHPPLPSHHSPSSLDNHHNLSLLRKLHLWSQLGCLAWLGLISCSITPGYLLWRRGAAGRHGPRWRSTPQIGNQLQHQALL